MSFIKYGDEIHHIDSDGRIIAAFKNDIESAKAYLGGLTMLPTDKDMAELWGLFPKGKKSA
jgi:hypothetical protein